jgi:hypothetical protein
MCFGIRACAGIAEDGRSNGRGELVGVLVGEVAAAMLTRRGDSRNKGVFADAGAVVPVGKRPPKPLSVERSARLQAKTLKDQWLRIPTQSGRGFRFEAGHRSDLIPATIPI